MSDATLPEKILVVDDDPTVGQGIADALTRYNVKTITTSDLDSALYLYNQNRLDVAVVELEFEPNPGLVLIQKWRKHEMAEKRLTGFILLVGNSKGQKSTDANLLTELADIEILVKPVAPAQLLGALAKAKATKLRNLKFEEIKAGVYKLAKTDGGKLDKAISVLDKQAKELGTKGLEMKAELYENHGQLDEALKVMDQLLVTDANRIGWLNTKSRLLLKKGDHKEALRIMEQADREAPNNIERINNLAMAYLKNNQPDKSMEKMHQLIKLSPEDKEMKFDLFAKLYEYGFDNHAQDLCKKTTGPLEVVRYYNNKGVALSKAGNVEGALMEYERSLQYYPKFKENYRILYNIALAHSSLKNEKSYRLALEYLDKCLALKGDFEKAQNARATIIKNLETLTKAS